MPKETDTNLRDFTAPRPPQKSNLGLPFVCVLVALLAFWWVLIVRDPFSRPEPVSVLADLEPPPLPLTPLPSLPPPAPVPRRVLTEHEILEQLHTTATEWLWIGRAAVLILGLGVVGIFAVSSRLQKVARARDREVDLLTGVALGQQRDLLAQLRERSPPGPPPPLWDDLER